MSDFYRVYKNGAYMGETCAKNGEFDKPQSNAVAYGWFVWQKGFNGEPVIRWK